MTDTVVSVSTSGTSLQSAWNSLPSTVASGDRYILEMAAGVYTAGLKVTSSAKTISGEVIIRPAVGDAWYDTATAVNYDNTNGVAIEAAPFNEQVLILQTNVNVEGLQIKPGSGSLGGIGYNDGGNTSTSISRCIILATATSAPCLNIGAWSGNVFNNIFITASTTEQPIQVNDTNGKTLKFYGNTVIKPEGGAGNWNKGSFGGGFVAKDNAIFGFSGSAAVIESSSSNNATDLSSFPGSSNVTSLTASDQFTDATAASLDVTPKSGNSLQAGVADALIGEDALGTTRADPPTIGAIEFAASGGTTLTAGTGSFTETGQTATLKAARKLAAAAGSFTFTGQTVALTGPGAKTLTAGTGSFTLTGQDANFEVAVEAGIASYTLTGKTAGLKAGRRLAASAGSYALTGNDAGLSKTRSMIASAGSFAMTGNDADLDWSGQPIWTPVPAASGTWTPVN